MNLGFFGLQFSFGLQQANMGPIYGYLGAPEAMMPLLWLAGPMTGLLVQPLVGAMSDRTRSPIGRRTPWILAGAALSSACLFVMPYSATLWMAAGLLWMLDAANNITMEPYRAYVADRLARDQHALGFLTQSAFTGLAQTLSYLAPSLLAAVIDKDLLGPNGIPAIVRIAFAIGAILCLASIIYSAIRVPELPLGPPDRMAQSPVAGTALPREILRAIAEMPPAMRQLAPAMLCQWYAMFVYWQFVAFALARSLYGTDDPKTPAFREAVLTAQQLGAFYNLVAFFAALALVPLVRRFGPRRAHVACLAAGGLGMIALPFMAAALPAPTSLPLLTLPMLGIGIAWAGMMGNTYVMLAAAVPAARMGVYMGVFNILIVVPMLLETVTMPFAYDRLLAGNPQNAVIFSGILLQIGAVATLLVDDRHTFVESRSA